LSFALGVGWLLADQPVPAGQLSAADHKAFELRFQRDLWPLLSRNGKDGCVGCHHREHKSGLQFFPDADTSFQVLLTEGFFEPANPSSLLARASAPKGDGRMPPGSRPGWTDAELQTLRRFVNDLYQRQNPSAARADETFPEALLQPYRGKVVQGLDTTFLSFRQLRGKVLTMFGDDWQRGGRDLFADNVHLFGGADFQKRFNESTKASAPFLTGLDMLARDVSTRAFLEGTGPFAGRQGELPSPLDLDRADAAYRREITRLYNGLLYRDPTEAEVQQAFTFLQNIYRDAADIGTRGYDLAFELTVEDDQGLKVNQTLTIPVSGSSLGLTQEWVDETKADGPVGRKKLDGTFTFKPDVPGQAVQVSNVASHGNVSVHAIEVKGPLPDGAVRTVTVADPGVEADGAWKLDSTRGLVSYEDENQGKGSSTLTLPIAVTQEGKYEVTLCWRASADNAAAVLAEVWSHDAGRLAPPPAPVVPPKGEAHYWIDQSNDAIAYVDLGASFRFGPGNYLEVNNKGTTKLVTADAVKFVPAAGPTLLVDNHEAEGRDKWKVFRPLTRFRAYNTVGPDSYSDENDRKGELWLRYKPSLKEKQWQPEAYYRVQVGYPAKRNHETRTPVVVKAEASTPIVQIAYPPRLRAGLAVELDASATYNVQHSPLRFTWAQKSGPRVALADRQAAKLVLTVPRMGAEQAAWEGLCRGLMRHPDFLFTRPVSLAQVQDPGQRRQLQLVKIALDLVGRPPTAAELDRLARGTSLETLIDDYVASQEFRDFYFHRVRLYLESHGTEVDDEPARLWCFVAFNDRPFKEILTADYTVDAKFQKQSRPAEHGRTGLLTAKGFIQGKPGLPHFNYAALVLEKFLGYVFEVPPEIVEQRESITAAATTSPSSVCYSCHKVLTPLAHQRLNWDDQGNYRAKEEDGTPIDASDRGLVANYPFAGNGMEAFALKAQNKERFIRSMINVHFVFYFGREMRYQEDERVLYKKLWDQVHTENFKIRGLIKALLTAPEYLGGSAAVVGSR
jgi:hypothetical protein